MKKKKMITVMVAFGMLLSGTALANGILPKTDSVTVFEQGTKVELSDKAFVTDGEIYLPVRELLKGTGSKIVWNEDRTLSIEHEYKNDVLDQAVLGAVDFAIDNNLYRMRDAEKGVWKTYQLKNAPLLVDSKTYVPYELVKKMNEKMRITNGIEVVIGEADEELLEKSLAWADGLKTRDGKPRYEMMTEEMQKKFIEEQKAYTGDEDWNYVIGYSSPWTISCDIMIFDHCAWITYNQTDSSPETYIYQEKLIFTSEDGRGQVVSACEEIPTENTPEVCAYIRGLDGNKITLDFAEWIDSNDTERIAELNLSEEQDFPNGFYVYNPEETTKEYQLTKDTLYTFIDWNREFSNPDSDMFVYTNDLETFTKYVNSYENAKPGMPFFFELEGDQVWSVTEHYLP